MQTALVAISGILWVLYAYLEGQREAHYWHCWTNCSLKPDANLHTLFTIQRSVVMIVFSILLVFTGMIWYESLIIAVSFVLMWSFVHNGNYYLTRNRIDKTVYSSKWFAQSKSSTAKLTRIMTPVSRAAQFAIGVTIWVVIIVISVLREVGIGI